MVGIFLWVTMFLQNPLKRVYVIVWQHIQSIAAKSKSLSTLQKKYRNV
jgi:hypothetical protein